MLTWGGRSVGRSGVCSRVTIILVCYFLVIFFIPAMYYTNEVTHLALCKCSNHSVDSIIFTIPVWYTQYNNPVMIIQNAPYPLQAILCRCLKHVMCKHNTGQDIFLLVLHVVYLYMLYVYYFDGRIAVSV